MNPYKQTERKILLIAAIISVILVLVIFITFLNLNPERNLTLILRTQDQAGWNLFQAEDYQAAAKYFTNPQWQATALFREGDYKQAASIYSGLSSPEAIFNCGNALLMQGEYQEAINKYNQALVIKPGWEDALVNKSIATARAEMLKKEGGEMTGGMLGADEIQFTDKKSDNAGQETVEGTVPGDQEMRAIWLRNVQTRPADFLKSKFAYQHAMNKDQK